jgi:hypothetical protein
MPMRGTLSAPAVRTRWPVRTSGATWHKVSELHWNGEVQVVVLFCAIGLLASFWLAQAFPLSDDTAALLAQAM